MRSIEFDETNVKITDKKDHTNTIYAYFDQSSNTIAACFQLSAIELELIAKTGKIWYKQSLYDKNSRMQPMEISATKIGVIGNNDDSTG